MQLLSHEIPYFSFQGTARLFSKAPYHFTTSPALLGRVQFLHILTSTLPDSLITGVLMNDDEPCNVTARAIFICISLIANDAEHLFAYYLVFMYLL